MGTYILKYTQMPSFYLEGSQESWEEIQCIEIESRDFLSSSSTESERLKEKTLHVKELVITKTKMNSYAFKVTNITVELFIT